MRICVEFPQDGRGDSTWSGQCVQHAGSSCAFVQEGGKQGLRRVPRERAGKVPEPPRVE